MNKHAHAHNHTDAHKRQSGCSGGADQRTSRNLWSITGYTCGSLDTSSSDPLRISNTLNKATASTKRWLCAESSRNSLGERVEGKASGGCASEGPHISGLRPTTHQLSTRMHAADKGSYRDKGRSKHGRNDTPYTPSSSNASGGWPICGALRDCSSTQSGTHSEKSICMRSKAWLAASVWLRLARLPPPASVCLLLARLCDTLAAAPGLLAHACVTATVKFSPRWIQN
jgi:hypothetical protein